jgi:hypothetical protein
MANNVIPIDPKKRIEASLQPAELSEAQAAVAMLAKALPIMPSIQDPPAFKAIMAKRLASYPADVLMAAVNQAIDDFKEMPSIHEMIQLCERLIGPRRAAQRDLRVREAREQEAAERRRRFRERLASAIGDEAPSLEDIELAEKQCPSLKDAGMPITWPAFGGENPRACAELCKRLAELARSGCADPKVISDLIGSAAREYRLRLEQCLAQVQAPAVETPVSNRDPTSSWRPVGEAAAKAMVEDWRQELGLEEPPQEEMSDDPT